MNSSYLSSMKCAVRETRVSDPSLRPMSISRVLALPTRGDEVTVTEDHVLLVDGRILLPARDALVGRALSARVIASVTD